MRTPTLPPATHTNGILIGDGPELVAIDPASPYPEERAALDTFLDAVEGLRIHFYLQPGLGYRVEASEDFVTWDLIQAGTSAEAMLTATDKRPRTAVKMFYRIVQMPN